MIKKIILIFIILIISISLITKNIIKYKFNDMYIGYYNGNKKLDEMPSKNNPDKLIFVYFPL